MVFLNLKLPKISNESFFYQKGVGAGCLFLKNAEVMAFVLLPWLKEYHRQPLSPGVGYLKKF
jgi:hypothetical protein